MISDTSYTRARRKQLMLIASGLVLVTILAYARIPTLGFLSNYDDALYVTGNPYVERGLTFEGIHWAFTTGYAANWHPLTWISHMVDVSLFGLNPAGHHIVSLLLHALNVLLLFFVLRRLTSNTWASAALAALWAVHPMHVESVAWISERKDVLSGLFWLLTIWAYERYARRPRAFPPPASGEIPKSTRGRFYLLALGFMACGLLAKPMVVTLPCVLLLLDFWPLKRFGWYRSSSGIDLVKGAFKLVAEKLPFFALSALSSVATVSAQASYGAVQSLNQLPMTSRIAHAADAYLQYLGKTYWPVNLAAIYPMPPDGASVLAGVSAAVFLLVVTVATVILARRMSHLIVGWLWFLGVLVPVIGLVQVGSQALADRYTYISHIGLFLALVWLAADLLFRRPKVAWGVTMALVAVLSAFTFHQVGYWKDPITLFRHTLAVTGPNPLAHVNLGTAYLDIDDPEAALAEFEEAARLDPDFALAQFNRGVALQRLGQISLAQAAFETAVTLDPSDPAAHNNLGLILAGSGRYAEAVVHYQEAIAHDPRYWQAYVNLGAALTNEGHNDEAEIAYGVVLKHEPHQVQARINLANLYARTGRTSEARDQFERALKDDPNNALAHYNLAILLKQLGENENALRHLNESKRLEGAE